MDSDWKSFIVSEVVQRTLTLANEECTACKAGNYCALLHACKTTSLLRKMECFFESRIRPQLLLEMQAVLNQFESRYILMDRPCNYIKVGHDFLVSADAHSLYYGRFITTFNDQPICGPCFSPYFAPPTKATTPPLDQLKEDLLQVCKEYDENPNNDNPDSTKKRKVGSKSSGASKRKKTLKDKLL